MEAGCFDGRIVTLKVDRFDVPIQIVDVQVVESTDSQLVAVQGESETAALDDASIPDCFRLSNLKELDSVLDAVTHGDAKSIGGNRDFGVRRFGRELVNQLSRLDVEDTNGSVVARNHEMRRVGCRGEMPPGVGRQIERVERTIQGSIPELDRLVASDQRAIVPYRNVTSRPGRIG